MKFLLWRGVILGLLLLGFLPALSAQTAARIREIVIRHTGPQAASDELIKANIRIKEGDPYNKLNVNDDVNNLYKTGYFYSIKVDEKATDQGIILTYILQGKPILTDIKFSGNKKWSAAKLLKQVSSKTGEPLDEAKLFADSRKILEKYQKAGLQKTTVKPAVVIDENAGRGVATFELVEAPKVKIKNVEFVGAHAFSQRKLRKTIKTRRHWMFSWLTGSGKLKDEQFEDDKDKLREFYRNEGYIDVDVKDKDIQFQQLNPKWMAIQIPVYEGKRYKVGEVGFKGDSLFPTNQLIPALRRREGTKTKVGLSMGVGQTFTPKGLSKDRQAVEDFYGARGYIDARVRPVLSPNTETGTMDLVYQIEEGKSSKIEKIEIKGNTKTKDRVIRRELAVAPGETFDMVRVKISTNRLYGLNYFEKVDAQPEETDVPNRRNLVIGVEEKNTGNVTMGAGFSTVDNVVGFVELSQGNFDLFNWPRFTGGGQKFRIRAAVGTQRQDYLASFIEPWFLSRRLALGVDLYHRDLQYQSQVYDEIRTGGRVGLTKALSEFWIGGVSYTLENVGLKIDESQKIAPETRVEGPGRGFDVVTGRPAASKEILAWEGYNLVSKVGASLAYDTRNSALLPDKGQRTELLAELAGGVLGGDVDYYKLELRHARYFRGFADGHVLELVARAGVMDHYSDSTSLPIWDRFYLGGMYSLRGYKYRDVGPRDENDQPIGGGTYWFGSAEYSIPIIERLRFAVFYDIGMVYSKAYSFNRPEGQPFFNDDAGVGIRLNLPIGPLRLDYGIPITHDPGGSSSGKFQFGVGYTREF
jgi:outer membrane protein insertion porin family